MGEGTSVHRPVLRLIPFEIPKNAENSQDIVSSEVEGMIEKVTPLNDESEKTDGNVELRRKVMVVDQIMPQSC